MKLGLFCIAHTIRERTALSHELAVIREILHMRGISLRQPKMGLHMTAIPPFWADEDAARLLAWGFDYWDSSLIDQTQESRENFKVWSAGFGFFRNPGEPEVFTLRLGINNILARAIERGRKKIPDIAKWEYPPENYDFNPHITIGEGKKEQNVYTLVTNRFLCGETSYSMKEAVYHLEAPKVLRKNEKSGRWEPVA